ncbi:WhiB family transcriptional regulator [Streptomyces sp. NPDC059696]|uniref:WhiB family transcriptional regulator n=1 Tax=Streptomyces sp. NPDC059696 TaxID=3346911 RepID=UPI0036D0BDFA
MSNYTGSTPDTKRKADWRDQGACAGQAELFFDGTAAAEADAKAVCLRCPVLEDCREWALTNREAYGTWGGLTEKERRTTLRIRIKDGTDKPRKGGRPRAACGTASAYDRHVKYGEPIDQACRDAHAKASAERRAKTTKREPAKCGTRPGYRQHLKNGETPCAPCRQANTDADNRLRRTGTSKVAV